MKVSLSGSGSGDQNLTSEMIVNKNRVSDTVSCESLVHIYIFSYETTQPNGPKLDKDDSWTEEITCCNEGCSPWGRDGGGPKDEH